MSKHARHQGHDSKYSRGPARWQRAALNSIKHPYSQAAQLYRARVTAALEVADRAPSKTQAYAFVRKVTRWKDTGPGYQPSSSLQIIYRTCSPFCMMMQVQLDVGTLALITSRIVDMETALERGAGYRLHIVPIKRSDIKRRTRCQVCGCALGG